MKKKKDRIAFFGVGLLGNQNQGPGIPSLVYLLNNLSQEFDLVFYRLSYGKTSSKNFKVRSLPFRFLPERINFFLIAILFLFDNLFRKFKIINALSALPAGRISVVLGKIIGKPVILHLHAAEGVAMPSISYGNILDERRKILTQEVCNKVKIITMLSGFQKGVFMQNLEFSAPVKIIHRGCDTTTFAFRPKEISNTFQILYVGYDEAVKNPTTALKVFSLVANEMKASLTMIGRGLNEKRFSSENIVLKNVFFRELISHSEMKDIFSSFDLLLITSVYESQSSVAIEAMASGTLVCGTHVGLLADLSGKTCITVPVSDPMSLAKEIIRLSKDPVEQNRLRRNARQWAETYNFRWTLNEYINLFNSIE